MYLWLSYLDRPQILPRRILAYHSEPRGGLVKAEMLLCLRQRGCAQVGPVTERGCSVAAAAGERTLGAGSAGGQAAPLLASALLLCQHTCHAQTPNQPCVMSAPEIKHVLSVDTCRNLTCYLQFMPRRHSAFVHLMPAEL